jgi:hypothetical protein
MRMQCVKAADQLTGWLCGDTLQEVVEGNPKLKVSGGRIPWPAGHVARPATTWHVTNLTKLVTPHWTTINTPCRWKSNQYTLPVVLNL